MKRLLKLSFAAILVVSSIAAVFAFTSKNDKKDFAVVTYYFTGADKRIGTGTNELVQSQVQSVSNWTTTNPGYTFSNNSFLAAIKFDDALITPTNAFNAVWTYYSTNSKTLPANNATFTVSGTTITVQRKLTN